MASLRALIFFSKYIHIEGVTKMQIRDLTNFEELTVPEASKVIGGLCIGGDAGVAPPPPPPPVRFRSSRPRP